MLAFVGVVYCQFLVCWQRVVVVEVVETLVVVKYKAIRVIWSCQTTVVRGGLMTDLVRLCGAGNKDLSCLIQSVA
jgi:hypothetical protein